MVDIFLSVQITRTNLGLANLEINDHTNFAVAPGTFGAAKDYNRTQVESVYVDGKVTTHRKLDIVTEPVVVEVYGADTPSVYANLETLVAAMSQDTYQIQITIGAYTQTWNCEAADVRSVTFDGPRLVASQLQVVFDVIRQPVPVTGAY